MKTRDFASQFFVVHHQVEIVPLHLTTSTTYFLPRQINFMVANPWSFSTIFFLAYQGLAAAREFNPSVGKADN